MAYEPLHHKYRPQVFADLVGQDAIATTLTNAIQSQRIAPAYLFSGPRGTGKTSSARILAKSLNCLNSEQPTSTPCGICTVCQEVTKGTSLDVIEVDAASNTGVDNIRDLIERAQFAPVQCRFKIYCLDEVHMLSTAAFNALLKTLEEPPDRVVFVLATTDPQRVLPTIISRCQRFDFRRIALDAMMQHLTYIAQAEDIAITPTAVELIAQVAQGGLRDAESLLDQLSLLAGEIDNTQVWDLVGSVPEQALLALLQTIVDKQPALMVEGIQSLLDRGREPLTVLQNLTGFYRDLLIAKTAPERRDLVAITAPTWTELCQLAQQFEIVDILANQQHLRSCEGQIKNSTQPRLWLEVALLGLLPRDIGSQDPTPVHRPSVQPASEPANLGAVAPTLFLGNQDRPASVSADAIPLPSASLSISEASKAESAVQSSRPPRESVVDATVASDIQQPIASEQITTESDGEQVEQATGDASEISIDVLPNPDEQSVAASSNVEVRTPQLSSSISPSPSTHSQRSTQPTVTADPPIPAVDLPETWQQLLQSLNLPSRALLKEHGQLLYWQGREVRIGIRKTLIRLAQGKVSELEETFEKCFDRKVKVTLEVLSEEQIQARPVSSKSTVIKAPDPSIANTPRPASPAVSPVPMNHSQLKEEGTTEAQASMPSSWQHDDDITTAARSFAQFFNGALVDPDPSGSEKTESAVHNQEG